MADFQGALRYLGSGHGPFGPIRIPTNRQRHPPLTDQSRWLRFTRRSAKHSYRVRATWHGLRPKVDAATANHTTLEWLIDWRFLEDYRLSHSSQAVYGSDICAAAINVFSKALQRRSATSIFEDEPVLRSFHKPDSSMYR